MVERCQPDGTTGRGGTYEDGGKKKKKKGVDEGEMKKEGQESVQLTSAASLLAEHNQAKLDFHRKMATSGQEV